MLQLEDFNIFRSIDVFMNTLDSKNLIKFLADIPFFSEVSKASLEHLCEHLVHETFVKNEIIFNKGDDGDCMYVILKGKVKIHENEHLFDELSTGECFGEYALIDSKKRSATVTTIERTETLKIDRQHFLNLMSNDNGFSLGILAVMIKRHRELDTIQEQLSTSKRDLELASSKVKGLIDGAMDAIIMFDSNFKIVLTNPSANKLLENEDVLQRNVLFFFDEQGAELIEQLVKGSETGKKESINNFISDVIKVIGSNEKITFNEGTISTYGDANETFYTLILRNIEERLMAEDQIHWLTQKTEYLEKEIQELTQDHGIIGQDKSILNALRLVEQVADTDATVLITGETGTGKELFARAIHQSSKRKNNPLIRINCGAIPANLIESELFGHQKGAFTGATSDRKGRFLLANHGTIFLDEIGELPLELQPKLLRVIQEGEFDPVGSSETVKVDVRIIAATHRDLFLRSKEGKFREDLFYRLNVFPIHIPALRERGKDVFLIANEMIEKFSKKLNKNIGKISENDIHFLLGYNWPGNVRELQNLIERAIIISRNNKIDWSVIIPETSESVSKGDNVIDFIRTSAQMLELEKENILKALKKTKWKISGHNGAAQLLQMPSTTLASRIKALGIERPI